MMANLSTHSKAGLKTVEMLMKFVGGDRGYSTFCCGWVWAAVSVFLLVGCIDDREVREVTTAMEKQLPAGYQCLVSPTSFDQPGVVFGIDRLGVKDYLIDLSHAVKKRTDVVAVGSYTSTRALSANFVAKMLSEFNPETPPLNVHATGEKKGTLTVQLLPPLLQEITLQVDTKPVIEWFKSFVSSDEGYDPRTRYFLVREAILAGGTKYKMDDSLISDLGGQAKLTQYASVTANLKGNDTNGFSLDQNFPQPLRVCIKPQALIVTTASADGTPGSINLKDISELPEIISVRSSRLGN